MNWKKIILYSFLILILVVAGYIAYIMLTTRSHSPADTVTYSDGSFTLAIDYSRPYKKGRIIFGEESEDALVPFDTYWRTGANEATEIEFNQDIMVEGESLEAGRYRFYTIPGKEKWIIGFNSQLGEWGYYEPDYSLDVLTVEAEPQETEEFSEQFSITTEAAGENQMVIRLHWDRTLVPIDIAY